MRNKLLIFLVINSIFIIFLVFKYFILSPNITSKEYHEITKIYFAPKSKVKIKVISKNYVPEDSDLGNGSAFVKLFATDNKTDTVFLKTSPENIDFINYKNHTIKFDCNQMQKENLYNYLISAGFQNLNRNEIIEIRDAMTLINYGSKAIFLKGQTKFIIVEE